MNQKLVRRVCTVSLFLVLTVGLLAAIVVLTLVTPTSTAQVGVPYSSSCAASGGNPPYTYSISAGALPNGLNIGTSNGAITGTPTTAGVFNFTCLAVDSPVLTIANPADAKRGVIAKNGTPTVTGTTSVSITVAAAPSPTPVPPSIWMAVMGLAGAGLFRMRQMRRA